MSINYSSIYSELANQEVDWIPGDTQKQYQQNLIDRPSMLGAWKDRRFTYRFNSQGFRCEEFSQDIGILFLGCSYTVGVGLPVEETWPYLVAKSLGLNYANLAQAGGSNDTAFRLGYHWIPRLKPKIVFLLSPEVHRFELVGNDLIHFLSPTNISARFKSYAEEWMICTTNPEINKIKNTSALQYICNQHDVKFFETASYDLKRIDYARDIAHPGVESNRQFAQSILNKENWW
jgi:hypothetical protein